MNNLRNIIKSLKIIKFLGVLLSFFIYSAWIRTVQSECQYLLILLRFYIFACAKVQKCFT